jgi:CheY-like chemotaxis protein
MRGVNAMRSYRLLIVDDDIADRCLYRRLLEQPGSGASHVRQAVSGAAGLMELRAGVFHCVLLNFDLPDMTGFEFLIAASADGELPCAVVLVTEQRNETVRADATKHGVHAYLAKDRASTTSLWYWVSRAVAKAEHEQRLACAVQTSPTASASFNHLIADPEAVETDWFIEGQNNQTASVAGRGDFWFELPAAAPEILPQPPPVTYSPVSPGYRVLVVDDLLMNRKVISAFLGSAGHLVTEAEGGEEAVWLASERPFDLILMDIRMPQVDGLEATRRIRSQTGPPGQVPILALTAHNSPDQKAKCRDAGMDGHLAKPVDFHTLAAAVDNVIAASAFSARR